LPKSNASKGPVPLHPLLSEFMLRWKKQTPYFQPRVANMLVEDYLLPASGKGRRSRIAAGRQSQVG
jgi:hypothetical protein